MKAHQKVIGNCDEWLTPRWILEPLGEFDLDPCSPVNRPWDTAKFHYDINDCGLRKQWNGRVWLNPPFNRYARPLWMQKMAQHGNGIMLIPAACETKPFADYVWGKCAGVLMLRKRPHYCYVDGAEADFNSGATMMLIAYGEQNFEILKCSGLGFSLIEKK